MRGAVLVISIGLNLALAAGWYVAHRREQPPAPATANLKVVTNTATKILPLVRRQFFDWSELESPDYEKYIANLRDIGCPEQTIRDLIVTDVDALYSKKRLLDVADPYAQWWRSEPDTNYVASYQASRQALDDERKALLTRLLGPDWIQTELAVRYRIPVPIYPLDGPILGALPDATKEAVYQLIEQYRNTMRSHPEGLTPAIVAGDENQLRAKLAELLNPAQLQEFLLRNSENAGNWRDALGQLHYFNATPDEFRRLFAATDNLDLQLKLLADSNDPTAQQQRQTLQQQREAAIRATLSPERYNLYVQLQDPAYQDAVALAQASGGSAQTVQTLYALSQATATQQALIAANTNLTDLQKQIEAKKAELAQLTAQALATGQTTETTNAPVLNPPVATVTTSAHTIQPGENLGILARTFSTTINDIMAVNPGVDFHALKPGDSINLPVIVPNPPPTPQ